MSRFSAFPLRKIPGALVPIGLGISLTPLLPFIPTASAKSDCRCATVTDIVTSGKIPGLMVAGGGKGPLSTINVEMISDTAYSFQISGGFSQNGCEGGEITVDCGLEIALPPESGDKDVYVPGTKIYVREVSSEDGSKKLVPSSFKLRKVENTRSNADPVATAPAVQQSIPDIPARDNPPSVEISNGQVVTNPANVKVAIPLGEVGLGTSGGAPYVSAGILSWGGPVAPGLAAPVHMVYNGIDDVAGSPASPGAPALPAKVTFQTPAAYPNEKHVVTPTGLFRVTGYLSDPATSAPIASAANTYVREYIRSSSSETAAVTLATQPVSWWKVSAITSGLKIEQNVEGIQRTTTYVAPNASQFTVNDGIEEKQITVPPVSSPSDPYSVQTLVMRGGVKVSKSIETYQNAAGKYRLVEKIGYPDPNSSSGESTIYRYYPDTASAESAGKLWYVSKPDGGWEVYEPQSDGTIVSYDPFESEVILNMSQSDSNYLPLTPAPGFTPTTAHIKRTQAPFGETMKAYLVTLGNPAASGNPLIYSATSNSANQVTNIPGDSIPDEIPITQSGLDVSYGSVISSSSDYSWLAGFPILKRQSNGKADYFQYQKSGDLITITQTTGVVVEQTGAVNPIVGKLKFNEISNQSTRVVSVNGPDGIQSRQLFYHTGSGFSLGQTEVYFYQNGKYLRTEINGLETSRVDRPDSLTTVERNDRGIVTTTRFSPMGTVLWTETAAGGGVPALRTTYDQDGLTSTIRVNGAVLSSTTVDGYGRPVSETDRNGVVTTTSYLNGGRTVQKTLPGGIIQIQEAYTDGSLKSHSGSGWLPEFHSSGADLFGGVFRIDSIGSSTAHTARKTTTYTDVNGQLLKIVKPSPSPSGDKTIEEEYFYYSDILDTVTTSEMNSGGGLSKALPTRRLRASLSAPSNTEIMRGEEVTGLDLSDDQSLTLGTTDRFTRREFSYVLINSVVYRKELDYLYADPTGNNPLITEISESVGFLKDGDSYQKITKVTQPSGRSYTTTSRITPQTASIVTTQDDSATTASPDTTTTEVNGHVQKVEKAGAGKNETYAYDSVGRLSSVVDFRGAATLSYYAYNNQLASVVDQLGKKTSYEYYPANSANAGKLKSVTRQGGSTEITTYNSRGQITGASGSGVAAKEYTYDDSFGDRLTEQTHGSQPSLTRWTYQAATGLLSKKRYNDANLTGQGFDYEYTPDGKLAKRTSAAGVVTTYTYDNTTRDLTQTAYTGEGARTPKITYSDFDGLGRARQVTETLGSQINVETLAYQPSSEGVSITYAAAHRWLPNISVSQRAEDAGRPGGVDLKNGTSTFSSQIFHYDANLGMLDQVNSANLTSALSYLPGTETLAGVSVSRSGSVIHQRSITTDLVGRKVGTVNKANIAGTLTTIATVGHQFDSAGRRQNSRRDDGTRWDYGYDSRSEVTSATKKGSNGTVIPGLDLSYAYDDMGNRTSSTYGSGANLFTRNYTPNALNQYQTVTHPGKISILSRSSSAVVGTTSSANTTINGTDTGSDFFYGTRATTTSNTNGRLVTINLTRSGSSTPESVGIWVPPASVAPTYDLDGNLQGDGRWTYAWDGENRLVSMTPTTNAKNNGAANVALSFAYDWMGRRIGKTIATTSSSNTTTFAYASYAYDGWNPVAEWSSTSAASLGSLQRTYLWGPDLASTGRAGFTAAPNYQAGGGVGGLIASTYYTSGSASDYLVPSYDPNGNVIAWSDQSGSLLRRVDYDPFGNAVLVEKLAGVQTKIPAFGFSTKLQDAESGLYYYGYRFYDPALGRWLSRDPLQEADDANQYTFAKNNGIDKTDAFGLFTLDDALDSLQRNKVPTLGKGTSPVAPGLVPGTANFSYYLDTQIFDEWLRLERVYSGTWWTALDHCPCVTMDPVTHRPKNPNPKLWTTPDDDYTTHKYHPGAEYGSRNIAGAPGSPHGNQCTYDKAGTLLTSIPSAGSADWSSPVNFWKTVDHYFHDVNTYDFAKSLGKVAEYYSVRPVW